jgi:hypothetical protein
VGRSWREGAEGSWCLAWWCAEPGLLVFDSQLTTDKILDQLSGRGINWLTLRPRELARLAALPASAWKTVTIARSGRYRRPRLHEDMIKLKEVSAKVRQLAVTNIGCDEPTLLITHDLTTPAKDLFTRYAERMTVENQLDAYISGFHLDALTSGVPLNVDLDTTLTEPTVSMREATVRLFVGRSRAGRLGGDPTGAFLRLIHFRNSLAATDAGAGELLESQVGSRRRGQAPRSGSSPPPSSGCWPTARSARWCRSTGWGPRALPDAAGWRWQVEGWTLTGQADDPELHTATRQAFLRAKSETHGDVPDCKTMGFSKPIRRSNWRSPRSSR